MDNKNKMAKALSELADEMNSFSELSGEIRDLKEVITDSNEELIATFVEGTKRILKKEAKDNTRDIKSLESSVVESLNSLKRGISEVERGVKAIKLPSNTDFRATGAMLKLPIKELTRSIQGFELPKKAEDAIPVRLSDGENFYKALDQIVQYATGGGGSSYAFDRQDGSIAKGATVQVTIGGKPRDAIVVVNPDGTNVAGGSSGGGLTDAELRASPVPITGSITVDTTGLATSVKQDTIIGHLDGVEGLLTTIDADTGTIATEVAGLLTDTELRATPVPVSGTVTADTELPTAAVLGATDANPTAPAVGAFNMLFANTAGTWNRMRSIENGINSTGSGILNAGIIAQFDDTTPGAITENQFGPVRMSSRREVYSQIRDASGNERGVNVTASNELNVLDSNSSSIKTAVETIDNAISGAGFNITQFAGVNNVTGSGTATGALRVELPTNGTGVIATVGAVTAITNALPAGTNAIGKLAANSGVDIGDVDVLSVVPGTGATNLGKAEDGGHTSGDVGVFNLGVRVDSPNVALTNTDADYSPITTNKLGSLRTAALEDDLATAATTHTYKYYTNAGAVTDGIIWSPAAGKRWFLTSLTINVSAAATVTIEDDVAAGDVVRFKFEFAANSGVTIPFPEVPMFSGEDAADLLVTTTAGNVYITCVGYEI